jgi:hypothetical protein
MAKGRRRSQNGAARFPVFSCRGGRCGSAVSGAVKPMRPAAGLPIRLRLGPTRRRSSACAAAPPGPPRHGSRVRGFDGDREHCQPPRDGHLALHELAALEGFHVRMCQLEPLAVLAAVSKALVPIPLNSNRVVCLDYVNLFRAFWQLNRKLTLAAAG